MFVSVFSRKKHNLPKNPSYSKLLKINSKTTQKEYYLSPQNFYRAGGEFDEYVLCFKSSSPLKIKFYLTIEEVIKNKGEREVKL
jgi:hypothetical protein